MGMYGLTLVFLRFCVLFMDITTCLIIFGGNDLVHLRIARAWVQNHVLVSYGMLWEALGDTWRLCRFLEAL